MSQPVALAPATSALARASRVLAPITRLWMRIWFQERSTTPLEITRIGLGAALLLHYGFATPNLLALWGDDGWMPRAILAEETTDPWTQSVMFYFTAPWQWIAFHALFLFCCAAFELGWQTRFVKWLVLIGQISYDYRNPAMAYGVDAISAGLLLILCFAPIGRALSWDRVREVHLAKRKDLNLTASLPPFTSRWAFACTRLMQIQMAVLFFFSAIGKLRRRGLVGRRRRLAGLCQQRLLQRRDARPVRLAVLAGQCRDLRHHPDRNRLSVPDLAAADAALRSGGRDIPASAVRPADEPLLLLLRHDHGTHELPAPRVADRGWANGGSARWATWR